MRVRRFFWWLVKWVTVLVTAGGVSRLLQLVLDITHWMAAILMLACVVAVYIGGQADAYFATKKDFAP